MKLYRDREPIQSPNIQSLEFHEKLVTIAKRLENNLAPLFRPEGIIGVCIILEVGVHRGVSELFRREN